MTTCHSAVTKQSELLVITNGTERLQHYMEVRCIYGSAGITVTTIRKMLCSVHIERDTVISGVPQGL